MGEATREELLEALSGVIAQSCTHGGDELDSMGLSAYAHGMRLLAREGLVVIHDEYGRRVIGKFTRAAYDD